MFIAECEPTKTERLEIMMKGFPCSQKHYNEGKLDPITEMQLTASKDDLRAYLKLTAYVYIKRAGLKEGENIYKEIGKIATYLAWEDALDYCKNLAHIRVPEYMYVNTALRLFNMDALDMGEEAFIEDLCLEHNG